MTIQRGDDPAGRRGTHELVAALERTLEEQQRLLKSKAAVEVRLQRCEAEVAHLLAALEALMPPAGRQAEAA